MEMKAWQINMPMVIYYLLEDDHHANNELVEEPQTPI